MTKPYAPQKLIYIYTLSCPRTGAVRYVGVTNNPKRRLSSHIEDSKNKKHHRANWINSLLRDGLKPIMTTIDETNSEEWQQCEIAWIAYYREMGCDLVNATDGGEGVLNPPEEVRRKMSGENHHMYGKHPSDETRLKKSEAIRGENNHNYGKHFSNETRYKMSSSQPNRRGVIQYTIDNVLIRNWDCASDAGRALSINVSNIVSCCRDKRKSTGGYIWRYADDPLQNG